MAVTFAAFVGTSSAVTPGRMVAIYPYFAGTPGSIETYDLYKQITDEPDSDAHAFFGNYFDIIGGDGAYTGLQQNGGIEKTVIFSI